FNDGGTLTVTDSDIDENTANRAGGGIEQNSGTTAGLLVIDNVSFDSNMTGGAPGNGGALHITGAGDSMITGGEAVDNRADSEGGAFWNGTGMMTIDGTFIEGNRASGDATNEGGGGVFNAGGTLSISNATIMNNDANGNSGSGGGILNDGGTLSVSDTTISDNDASRAGGGIEDNSVSGGMLTLTSVILSNNEVGNSPGNGGGLHITGPGDSTITGGEVTGNVANSEGGGLWNGTGVMSVSGTLIDNNTASGGSASNGGGGIFNNGGTLEISDLSITNNLADGTSGSGGGVFSTAGAVTMDNVIIDSNAANRAGGAIEMIAGTMDITNSELTNNDVNGGAGVANPGNGGAFHVTGMGATINIEATKVSGNAAANEGGGLWNQNGTTMNILTTTVDNNTAADGGGVYNNTAGVFNALRSTISSNTASASGGGITNDGAIVDLNAVTVANNTAASGGGIQSNTSTSLKNTIVAGNSAGSGTDVSGSFTSNDYNLIGTDDTNAFPEAANDIEEADPMFGPLQDNGGPTETHEILDGSLAYDAGDPTDNFADQRGEAVFASARDIGAFEAQEELLGIDDFTTDTEGIVIYPNPSKGVSIAAIPQSFGAEVRVTIVELSGKIVRDYTILAGENDIDFRGMANGVYVVQFVSENRTSTHRVIL
ncbi:choice-of-anchor Q domain-containing protein, partial [Jejudonia soesokkakensis]